MRERLEGDEPRDGWGPAFIISTLVIALSIGTIFAVIIVNIP